MAVLAPRVVFVTRESEYEVLIARHATKAQARFFLETRDQSIAAVEAAHDRFHDVLAAARMAVPDDWRQVLVRRDDLNRVLFAPTDIICAVGQDGLIANVAKYLGGQQVLGINPDPASYDGILVRLDVDRLAKVLPACVAEDVRIEARTMVQARLDNGERLLALNEVFVGHRSHQSARYRIEAGEKSEVQSSSGLIVASGTGATGWGRSIADATDLQLDLHPEERSVGFWVREPFPSVTTGTNMRSGKLAGEGLSVISRMNDGGTIFADGIEQDFIEFGWGREVVLGPADQTLNLVLD
ncbi:hypothetical protein [Croceicoccus sp. Ery5]|uniref:hypothetical protein n=1 Tax=Croceicoccus sp. Ery5 TaxID=1703340 RepID=UPI001E2EEC91|nr:hypothetical protein [Croceicoccus sp. Ery5]